MDNLFNYIIIYLLIYLFILGYIMNYYEGSIANNDNLLAYPTNEEIHLIIHEAHEQAIAFAQILEFVGYENLFYGGTFNTLAYESNFSEENSNQDDEKLEENNNTDNELNEISKAADLINTCDISNLEENTDLKESQMEIDLMHNQSKKTIIQEYTNELFQTGVLLSGQLDISFLASQRHKHEAYSSQRMERIWVTSKYEIRNSTTSTFNSNKINNIVALAQNEGAKSGNLRIKRWQKRSWLEVLERHQNAPGTN